MDSPHGIPPESQRPLERFRAPATRARLHPLERGLLGVVALQLVFLPWALGGMYLWSQIPSLVLSLLAFGLALWPRNYTEEFTPEGSFRLLMWPKLKNFPIFWLGLLFLGTIVVQALNPNWQFMQGDQGWWMQACDFVNWLPHGAAGPRWIMTNPWRELLVYASAWLLVCALWVGVTRRRTLQLLLTVLIVNAGLLAVFGIAQRALGADKMFWIWPQPGNYFVSTFIYKNHAGAYFNLMLSLCAAMAYWHFSRASRRFDKSNPGGVFAFVGILVAMLVIFSYSRTATLLCLPYLAVLLISFLVKQIWGNQEERSIFVTLTLAVVLVTFLWLGLKQLRVEKVIDRIDQIMKGDHQVSVAGRQEAAQATIELIQRDWLWGGGAGSFRFMFPLMQQYHPPIWRGPNGKRIYFEHAHNDYLEYVAEFGLWGGIMALAALVVLAAGLLRIEAQRKPMQLLLLGGLALVAIHSVVDFNAHNPAILLTWCALWPILVRWGELEDRKTDRL